MKKKAALILAVALTLPVAVFADDISFTSTGGVFTGDSLGFVLTDATLTQITGLGGDPISGSDLGTVSFNTALLGSLSNVGGGGPFDAGGTITIAGNGSGGGPSGVLFSGTFPDGGTWGYVLQPDGSFLYTMTANISGQDGQGNPASGTMTFVLNNGTGEVVGTGIFPGTTSASGTANFVLSAPEPGELSLLGIAVVGIVSLVRRRFSPR